MLLSVCGLTTLFCTKIQLAPYISKLLHQSNGQNKDEKHFMSFPFSHPESYTCGTKRQVLSQKLESTRVIKNSSADLQCRESRSNAFQALLLKCSSTDS